jgi:tyrosinase
MRIEITIDGADTAGANYIGWAPVHASMRLVEADEGTEFVNVLLQNQDPAQGGQIVFSCALAGEKHDRLQLRLPADGTAVSFFIAGQFGRPSTEDEDAVMEVVEANTRAVLFTKALMVRIRKNANDLTDEERYRFLSAFASLNKAGRGRFTAFRDMHRDNTSNEAHTFPAFLSWHRAYLLDLERELQMIDPSVALPYWAFDKPAPRLFSPEFIGVADDSGTVQFDQLNPLNKGWVTDGQPGIVRKPDFVTSGDKAEAAHWTPFGRPRRPVGTEERTLLLGEPRNLYARFVRMEGDPHGTAHVSFPEGYISLIDTAARDPLFFLLHANVDRLWAKWQWFYWRFNTEDPAAYHPRPNRIGHYLKDTMWPWNQDTNPPRPVTAPGGTLAASPTANAPGSMPTVDDVVDYQGVIDPGSRLGFDYDDVPFQLAIDVEPGQEEPF